ncbi:acetyl-CoA hydrolase/transferase C-terminal domain-containing protein [Hyphomicrobium sp. CS1GBMeth3]|uniref:acetyl-CoA hydrolase/transferase C-terminal domain-containing protein n=1 Tax=Hyphomicrobium sp. CS1GBMeth3 TaxID=1892845 RepID=UPI000930D6A1|nr:acetyl-CoA hydrolase/transferase C-terminal domain-containing protein [Hyphomicrobium sp. CS1GBMeth3]
MTKYHANVGVLADHILDEVGKDIALGLPLGLGKANHVANELYARAAADRTIRLRIFTALTLVPFKATGKLERRFVGPLNERLFAGYPRLLYADAVLNGAVPPNIEVHEFFLLAGHWLHADLAQQNYIAANYSHAARYLADHGLNVIAQLVAKRGVGTNARLSLSCNPDITLDLLPAVADRRKRGETCLIVGQVNSELPFMGGEASLPATVFDHVLEEDAYEFPLFGAPRLLLSDADHAIGLRCASLIPDGGTLEIGIGSVGDALAYALCLRHQHNDVFCETLRRLDGDLDSDRPTATGRMARSTQPFAIGLYGMSEMFVEGFLDIYRAGILKRQVEDGALLHAGFFLGSHAFYRSLREMPDAERDRFRMTAISFVNEVYGQEGRKRRARIDARFVNTAMMVTALGAAISDTLEDGRVVSGTGGQHDLVTQAFALDGARSVMTLRATRDSAGGVASNIVWKYGQTTVSRHLRDIVITEYGTADVRGQSDRDCIDAMVAITDARFQDSLIARAKRAGKLEKSYRRPSHFQMNTPDRVSHALEPAKAKGFFDSLPFGSDLTEAEQRLLPALKWLKKASGSKLSLARAALKGLCASELNESQRAALERLALECPNTLKERLLRAVMIYALSNATD